MLVLGRGLTMAALLPTQQGSLVLVVLLNFFTELADLFFYKYGCHRQHA